MKVIIYLIIFVVGGTFGFLLACILAAGAAKERDLEDRQKQEPGKPVPNQELP